MSMGPSEVLREAPEPQVQRLFEGSEGGGFSREPPSFIIKLYQYLDGGLRMRNPGVASHSDCNRAR